MRVNVEKYLNSIHDELMAIKPQKIGLSAAWCNTFKAEPGIYLFRDKKKIVYVGETGNLCGRMNDVRRTVNHTFRRNIGNTIFSHIEGWEKATSKKRFIDTIEEMVDEHFKRNLTVAVLSVPLGRCELEEFIINKYNPEYNKKRRRK